VKYKLVTEWELNKFNGEQVGHENYLFKVELQLLIVRNNDGMH
jgi:hypothetical protein